MGTKRRTFARMGWREICHSDLYRGRWVALDNVRYDPVSSVPIEADVVDVDEDLADLCARMRSADRTACAILFCDVDSLYQPVPPRRPSPYPRAMHN